MQRRRELIGGTIFFIFAAVYFVMALQIPEFNDGFVSSDAMPKIYGILLMLLSAGQIFGALRQKKDASEQGAEAGSGKIVIVPEVLITFFFLILYVVLLKPVGFVISTIIFLLGMITLFTPKEKRSVIKIVLISVIFSIAVYWLFAKVLSLSLPQGILKNIF